MALPIAISIVARSLIPVGVFDYGTHRGLIFWSNPYSRSIKNIG